MGVGIWKPKALKAASFWWKISPQAIVFSFLCLQTTHIFSKKEEIILIEHLGNGPFWGVPVSKYLITCLGLKDDYLHVTVH